MTFDRFDPLCINPQNLGLIEHPGEININYRLIAKDMHRPCIPEPMDQTLALPKGTGGIPCEPIMSSACAAYTGELRNGYERYATPFDNATQPY